MAGRKGIGSRHQQSEDRSAQPTPKETRIVLRRDLLKTAAGLSILRSGMLHGQTAPSNKLNVALVGVWGRGTAHYDSLIHENVVALCDTNDQRLQEAVKLFPKARTYWDWRRMLDQKDIEARHLHRRPPSRPYRQLGAEPRNACVLRKASGNKYNGITHGASSRTHCDFDYSGTMMEQMLLGLIAHRAGKRLEYDPAAGRITNASEANEYLKRTYRAGWTLNG